MAEFALAGIWLLQGLGEAEIERRLRRQNQAREYEDGDKRLCCIACGHPITRTQDRIDVQGAHTHTCTNPHGIRFHLGCFRAAGGCGQVGRETLEFTWFPGCAWRIALCNGCGVHLGWGFRARDGERFFGLILNRLCRPN